MACACDAISFDGMWGIVSNVTLPNVSKTHEASLSTHCFGLECPNVASVMASQSLVCYGHDVTLSIYQANLTFRLLDESCVSVSVSVTAGRVYSETPPSPLALSFLQTNFDLIRGNAFAVVTNTHGVTVGQINGDVIHVNVQSSLRESYVLSMGVCVMRDVTMEERGNYPIYDLGVLMKGKIHPLGVTITSFVLDHIVCFSNFTLSMSNMSFILITRVDDYETAKAYTNGEAAVVLTSGALFCFGSALVVLFYFFSPFNLAVFAAWVQSVCLLTLRGVYFFLLESGYISVGSLLDFAIIEAPSFFYIGLFLQIILVAYWLFFKSEDMASSLLIVVVAVSLLLNWLVFAAILLALAYSDTSSDQAKFCDCQLSAAVQQSDVAQLIRIVYKSVIVVIAMCVVLITVSFGRHKTRGIQNEYYNVLGLSLGLLLDCVAFLIYYSVNTPSAYFLVVLWFTELLPICVVNAFMSWGYMRHWVVVVLREMRS